MTFRARLGALALVGAFLATLPAGAENYENTSAYKSALRDALATGKTEKYAKIYAKGFAIGKDSGLTDVRARLFADSYMRAMLIAFEQGKSGSSAEAYATDYAGRALKGN